MAKSEEERGQKSEDGQLKDLHPILEFSAGYYSDAMDSIYAFALAESGGDVEFATQAVKNFITQGIRNFGIVPKIDH